MKYWKNRQMSEQSGAISSCTDTSKKKIAYLPYYPGFLEEAIKSEKPGFLLPGIKTK
jgi:hypothetical protein